MTEASLRQGKAVQHLMQIRWVVAAVLFFLYAFLVKSFALESPAWRPMIYLLGAYAACNVLLRLVIGSRLERASPDTVSGVATLGLLSDMAFMAAFSYLAPESFRPISFA